MPTTTPSLRWVRRAPKGISPLTERPRLGVLGGTFNPVTCAHLGLADLAQEKFSLAEVLFLLPETLPHRTPQEASFEDRRALVEAALAPRQGFSLAVCSHGLLLEMARALTPHYPALTKTYFLLGNDAAERILRWDYAEPEKALAEMFGRFDLIVAERDRPFSFPRDARLEAFRGQVHRLALPAEIQEVSATEVRNRVRAGRPLDDLVPAPVAELIRRRGLYRAR